MSIVINANNFPTYFQDGAVSEPLFFVPDGSRTRYCIGWRGVGRYTAGSLRVWKKGARLVLSTDYAEESNGMFFNFSVAPSISDSIYDYFVTYVPRAADAAKTAARNLFLFPNWMGGAGISDAFAIGKNLASHTDATASSAGSGSAAQSKVGVVLWCSLSRDAARAACSAAGGHLSRNREYGNILQWCEMHDLYPAGNNTSGVDGMGVAASADPTQAGRSLAGTGPKSWTHNLRSDGIADIVGNCWEYVDGLELRAGVFWLANANNVLENSGISLDITATSGSAFSSIKNGANAIECIPTISSGDSVKGGDGCWYEKTDSRLLLRSGGWYSGALAGLFSVDVTSAVSYSGSVDCGFRLAYSLDEFDLLSL